MVTLKPPFRANDMNGLYKRVLKGVYPAIANSFSAEMAIIISRMLQVDPKTRPSCQQILEMEIVRDRCRALKIEVEGLSEDV